MSTLTLPEASPRGREVQHVVLQLVEAYAFAEAAIERTLSKHQKGNCDDLQS